MRIRLLAAGLAAGALLSGCGSSESPTPATETTGHHGGYAACLAEHGVSTPPIGPGAPPGVDAGTWAKASQACADSAPGPS